MTVSRSQPTLSAWTESNLLCTPWLSLLFLSAHHPSHSIFHFSPTVIYPPPVHFPPFSSILQTRPPALFQLNNFSRCSTQFPVFSPLLPDLFFPKNSNYLRRGVFAWLLLLHSPSLLSYLSSPPPPTLSLSLSLSLSLYNPSYVLVAKGLDVAANTKYSGVFLFFKDSLNMKSEIVSELHDILFCHRAECTQTHSLIFYLGVMHELWGTVVQLLALWPRSMKVHSKELCGWMVVYLCMSDLWRAGDLPNEAGIGSSNAALGLGYTATHLPPLWGSMNVLFYSPSPSSSVLSN